VNVSCRELRVDGAAAKKASDEKLLVKPYGLARILEERKNVE